MTVPQLERWYDGSLKILCQTELPPAVLADFEQMMPRGAEAAPRSFLNQDRPFVWWSPEEVAIKNVKVTTPAMCSNGSAFHLPSICLPSAFHLPSNFS